MCTDSVGVPGREPHEDLLAYCRDELGEALRVFTRYGKDTHDPIYTRPDVLDRFEVESRGVFRYPLVKIHNGAWEMYAVHGFLDEPDVVMSAYGDVLFVQIPVSPDDGILVTFDRDGDLPDGFLSECKSIVHGSD